MTDREKFEAWARPRWTHPEDFHRRITAPDKYNSYEVQAAWDAWQERAASPAPSVLDGLHPLATVRWWADAYTHPGDDHFRGHGMAAALLREYAALRAALEAAPEAKP